MSGQMQDLIPLDDRLEPVCNAILYSDGRAEAQAARLEAAVGADRFLHITGNRCDGSLPLPKLMWLREFQPELYRRTAHVLISSKDYLIARLTGACCGDVTACSTAGAMDIRKKCWSPELLEQAGVERKLFPALLLPHQPAGTVLPDNDCGYLPGTPVFAGIGDAGAATLAGGIVRPGQYNINLGTSGWVASVSEDILLKDAGVFHLAAAETGQYISVVPFLNAGNVHNWACRTYAGGDYDRAEALARSAAPGSGGLLFLPYLNGERYPVLEPDIRGGLCGHHAGNYPSPADAGGAGRRGLLSAAGIDGTGCGSRGGKRLRHRRRKPVRCMVSDPCERAGPGDPDAGGRHLSARAGSGCHRPEGTGGNCRLPSVRREPFRWKLRAYLLPVPGSSGSV